MPIGILGTKLGMTIMFDKRGNQIAVTLVQAGPCTITQIKTKEQDGYNSIQLGYKTATKSKLNKPQLGHLAKTGETSLNFLKEFKNKSNEIIEKNIITVNDFSVNQKIKITGSGKGHGFMGCHKRHNFARGPMTHGSKNHRLPGSIGAGSTPGRVYPGTKMAGNKKSSKTTLLGLEIFFIEPDLNLLVFKGSIPGKKGSLVKITSM
uniref:Large ribosomal subunit protein uL3c n=1 Tax=Gloeochaete wittrockiana TaxID=38269 RepID=A0A3G1IVY5_9EUKA|nr:ribosomal protein L13 [Gloeochaete wittrockiana]ASQ40214.1 ribosomal protein L13 [Gloeochaete wittrockiana]